jgi:hypothetical protein
MERVEITIEAAKVLNKLKKQYKSLIFHQSGGCCDGSSPMLLEKGDFYLDENDVLLGVVEGGCFYMSKDQFEYRKHTHLTIDVTKGRGASFSLEIPLGFRFIIHSRLFLKKEIEFLNSKSN